MADPWEDQYDTITEDEESGPWQDFAPVIRNAAPGSLTPPDLVPAVRKVGGELAIGEPGDTHPDIIDRDKIPAKDIDQRVFVGPWDEVYDREGAKQVLGGTVKTEFEPGRVHSTDLIKATEQPSKQFGTMMAPGVASSVPFPELVSAAAKGIGGLISTGLNLVRPSTWLPEEAKPKEFVIPLSPETEARGIGMETPQEQRSRESREMFAVGKPIYEIQPGSPDEENELKRLLSRWSTPEGLAQFSASAHPLGGLSVLIGMTPDLIEQVKDVVEGKGTDEEKRDRVNDVMAIALMTAKGKARQSLAEPVPPKPTVPVVTPEVVTPEAIASKLGLRYRGTMRGIDQYVYDEPSPKTGAPSGITVSVPKGTGEAGVSAKMTSRLAEYEITPPTKTVAPTLPTAEELLKASPEKIAEIRSVQGEELTAKLASEMTEAQLKEAEGIIVEYLKQHAKAKQDVEAGRITPQDFVNIVMERNKGKFLVDVFAHLRRPLPEIPKKSVEVAPVAERAKAPEESGLGLPAPSKGTVRVYSGGMGSSWYSTNLSRANEFAKAAGGAIRYVDVPREVFDKGATTARKEGSFTPGDAVLPNEWVNRSSDLRADLKKKSGKIKTLPTPEPSKAPEYVPSPVAPEPTPISSDPIIAAAYRTPSGKVISGLEGKDFQGVTHMEADMAAQEQGISVDESMAGFLTRSGRFLNRDQAFNHAKLTGQVSELSDTFEKGKLHTGKITEYAEPTPPAVSEKAMGAAAPVAKEPWQMTAVEARASFPTLSQEKWDAAVSAAWKDGRLSEDSAPVRSMFRSKPRDFGEIDAVLNGRIRPSKELISRHPELANLPLLSEKGMGAAVPEEFPQPEPVRAFREFDGWAGRAKEALLKVKEYFTPPQVGELPEVEIQSGAVLPRLPDYAKEKVIASAPHGMAKVPGLGAIMDTRATAHTPADAAFLARANSVSKGKTFAAMWAQTQWRYKDLFRVEQDTGTFRLANGERGYLSDVIEAELRDPGSQPLTHAQWQWIHNEWKPILDEIRRQLHNEGVSRISTEDMEFDLATDYFPRPAIGKRNRPATGAGGRPAGRPGAKQFFQKSRKFASEQEGARPGTPEAPKEEIIYDPDTISRVTKFISGSYRAIADHRLANDPALGAGTVPDYWGIGRQTMAGPAFAGKIYPVEIAQKIERQFAQDVRGWVRNTANLTSAAKALMATADVSAPFIQGAAMFGRNPVRWAKATINSYRALTDPNFVAKLMEHPRYKELAEGYSQSGGSLLQLQDFLAGLREGQIATRIPGYGRFLTATGRSYGAFLDLAKLELFDAWRNVTPKSELPRLVETIENSLFMGRMEQAGMNPHRAIGERLLFFAPSYYRGAAGLVSTAFQKGVSGKMARQMLGGYAAASMLVTMSAYLAMGMDWDEIKQRLQPGRGKFLKVPVSLGDGERVEVGFGNILTQIVRLGFQAANYHTSNKPIDTGVEANPYLRFLRGRAAFIPGVAIELATGRDYFGRRISAKESLVRHFSPFVFQSMFPRDEASIRQRAGDAAFTFFGLNAYAESEYEKARNQMDLTARKVSGKPFSQLTVPERAKVVYQFKLTPEYKKREPSPTDMERIININAERQANLQKSLGESAEKLARMGLRVPGYRSTFQYKGVAVPMTERERERYQEILSGLYKTQIGKLNESTVLKSPVPQREKWWSEQAEKIGIEARRRLAGEISANKIK